MIEHEPSNDRTLVRADVIGHRLRGAVHDIRSLLGPIGGFAELIADSDDIERCRSHATRIAQASDRIEQLADELVDRILDGGAEDQAGTG